MEEYAAPNVVYLPSALLVHRCDDSAGCCATPGQTCSSVEHVEELVNFVVHSVVSGDAHGHHRHSAKKRGERKATATVSLKNHTQCECVGRNNLRARRSSFVHRLDMTVQ
jgi:PDGF/VEGF domain